MQSKIRQYRHEIECTRPVPEAGGLGRAIRVATDTEQIGEEAGQVGDYLREQNTEQRLFFLLAVPLIEVDMSPAFPGWHQLTRSKGTAHQNQGPTAGCRRWADEGWALDNCDTPKCDLQQTVPHFDHHHRACDPDHSVLLEIRQVIILSSMDARLQCNVEDVSSGSEGPWSAYWRSESTIIWYHCRERPLKDILANELATKTLIQFLNCKVNNNHETWFTIGVSILSKNETSQYLSRVEYNISWRKKSNALFIIHLICPLWALYTDNRSDQ